MAEEEYENSFEDEDEEPYIPEEEPPYKEETRRFIGGLASLALREMVILVIGIMAVAINVMFEMGVSIPLLGKDQYLITGYSPQKYQNPGQDMYCFSLPQFF